MSDVDSLKELVDGTNALMDWFKSQELQPADAVMLCESFIARMTVANEFCSPIPDKLKVVYKTIEELVDMYRTLKI